MEIRIQSIHFDASEQLQAFINKKIAKLEKLYDDIKSVEVSLKVIKPEETTKTRSVNPIKYDLFFIMNCYFSASVTHLKLPMQIYKKNYNIDLQHVNNS